MSGASSSVLRWRPLTPLLLAASAVLLVAGVVERNPVPLFLALPLLLAPASAALTGPRRTPVVRVDWGDTGAAAEVRLHGTIVTEPGLDARDLLVRIERPSGLAGDRVPQLERTEESIRFRTEWVAPEPTIATVRPPEIVWRDPAGLVERDTDSNAEPLVVTRYPPEVLRIGPVRLERTTPLPGETRSRQLGESGEFHGIRPARPEDPPRLINWRATARAGRALANEFQLDKTGDLLIVLDARPTLLGRDVDEHLLSVVRATAYGLSESFLSVKSRVGLAVFGEFLEVVPLASGRTQRIRIGRALESARLSPVSAPPERCAVAARRHFPPGLTTVVFASLSDDPTEDVAPYLRRRGFPVVVLSPSPLALPPPKFGITAEDEELAARIAQLVRRHRVARAWQEAPTIDWEDFWSLGPFVDFVRRPRVRRVG